MALKIYTKGNMIAHENTGTPTSGKVSTNELVTNKVYKWPKNAMFYSFDSAKNVFGITRFSYHQELTLGYDLVFTDIQKEDGTSFTSVTDLQKYLDTVLGSSLGGGLAISSGEVYGQQTVNKFGRADAGVQTTATDIWDRADATPTQQIWLAPTAPRIHTIASTSAEDDTGGTGVDTVTVFYLPDWSTKEASEVITGDINAGIAMANAAVIIHRMRVTPQATTTNNNVGIITATAASDGTVTAEINANEGQTQMAIYGVPRGQSFYMSDFYGSINKAQGAAATINTRVVQNPNPDVQTLSYIIKNTRGVQSTGSSSKSWIFDPPFKVTGPSIIKIQGIASAADAEGSGGFNGILKDD